jgi:hypothetical protein
LIHRQCIARCLSALPTTRAGGVMARRVLG